jgi:hypothetical protein
VSTGCRPNYTHSTGQHCNWAKRPRQSPPPVLARQRGSGPVQQLLTCSDPSCARAGMPSTVAFSSRSCFRLLQPASDSRLSSTCGGSRGALSCCQGAICIHASLQPPAAAATDTLGPHSSLAAQRQLDAPRPSLPCSPPQPHRQLAVRAASAHRHGMLLRAAEQRQALQAAQRAQRRQASQVDPLQVQALQLRLAAGQAAQVDLCGEARGGAGLVWGWAARGGAQPTSQLRSCCRPLQAGLRRSRGPRLLQPPAAAGTAPFAAHQHGPPVAEHRVVLREVDVVVLRALACR